MTKLLASVGYDMERAKNIIKTQQDRIIELEVTVVKLRASLAGCGHKLESSAPSPNTLHNPKRAGNKYGQDRTEPSYLQSTRSSRAKKFELEDTASAIRPPQVPKNEGVHRWPPIHLRQWHPEIGREDTEV